ncbi:MAG: 50S ribosomal protein L13 [Parcubacteria group bacterium]|nr:50S ribosomal protein L13 [Parcubacteria group bacterium]
MPFVQPQVKRETHVIDATGQVPGRLATQISKLLQGKHKVNYEPQWDLGDSIVVKNVSQMKISEKKGLQKIYYHYSGYPGGMKERKLKNVFAERPERVLYLAVYRMLPKNKLRDRMIKRLVINR